MKRNKYIYWLIVVSCNNCSLGDSNIHGKVDSRVNSVSNSGSDRRQQRWAMATAAATGGQKRPGITNTSKVTRLDYSPSSSSHQTTSGVINKVDIPGHADFSGEVNRNLSTVDGVVLVSNQVSIRTSCCS
jgi:predicted membrane GTPase involved in stress response